MRDPFKRLMSCYTDRVVDRRELFNSPKLKSGAVDLPCDPDPDFFFQNLEAYKAAASVIKHHAIHTWLFTGPRLDRYTGVYRVEALDALRADLSHWVDEPVMFHRQNSNKSRVGIGDLNSKTVDALRPFLDAEYEFLKDHYPDPPHI